MVVFFLSLFLLSNVYLQCGDGNPVLGLAQELNNTGFEVGAAFILLADSEQRQQELYAVKPWQPFKNTPTKHLVVQDIKGFSDLVNNSNRFAENNTPFPTQNNRVAAIAGNDVLKQQEILEDARNTNPVMDLYTFELCFNFFNHKKASGSEIEKSVYLPMTFPEFIDRLLTKRLLTYANVVTHRMEDSYLLRETKAPDRKDLKNLPSSRFEMIGTDEERAPLLLKDYLSPHEMQLAALIGSCGPTYFINDGGRGNEARLGAADTYVARGIYAGFIGANFEREGMMEWEHEVASDNPAWESKAHPDLVSIWKKYHCNLSIRRFDDIKNNPTALNRGVSFKRGNFNCFLDSAIYGARMHRTIELILDTANDRAQREGKKADVHVVGLGLSDAWAVNKLVQTNWMLGVYEKLLTKESFPHISDIWFDYFPGSIDQPLRLGSRKDGDKITECGNDIVIHFTNGTPAAPFKKEQNAQNTLRVAIFAADSATLVGNEYWVGLIGNSGDPAAVCCSTVGELHNPYINSFFSAKNLIVYAPKPALEQLMKQITGNEYFVVKEEDEASYKRLNSTVGTIGNATDQSTASTSSSTPTSQQSPTPGVSSSAPTSTKTISAAPLTAPALAARPTTTGQSTAVVPIQPIQTSVTPGTSTVSTTTLAPRVQSAETIPTLTSIPKPSSTVPTDSSITSKPTPKPGGYFGSFRTMWPVQFLGFIWRNTFGWLWWKLIGGF